MIPYSRQQINEADIEAVVSVLRSDFLTQGPAVPAFEQALCDYTSSPHAIAVNSGTSALHLACMALGVQPGQRVWTSPITFVASANCARYCGADVSFVDVDPQSGNLSVQALEQRLEAAERNGTLPHLVIPVHFSGAPCPMEAIAALGKRYGFRILEDASHALGARIDEAAVGNGHFADITVLSFHPVKMITTAEGGAALTCDDSLAESMRQLRTHGITKDAALLEQPGEGSWYYEQQALGYNYRMTDLQAALGLSQLPRLDSFVEARLARARRYDRLLRTLPVQRPPLDETSSWHLYPIRLRESAKRQHVFESMRAAGIGVQVHYIPVHLQPYYRRLGFSPGDYPNAEHYYAGVMSLPLFPDLKDDEQDRVVTTLRELLGD